LFWLCVADDDVVGAGVSSSPIDAAVGLVEGEGAVDAADASFGGFARVVEIVVVALSAQCPVDGAEEAVEVEDAEVVEGAFQEGVGGRREYFGAWECRAAEQDATEEFFVVMEVLVVDSVERSAAVVEPFLQE